MNDLIPVSDNSLSTKRLLTYLENSLSPMLENYMYEHYSYDLMRVIADDFTNSLNNNCNVNCKINVVGNVFTNTLDVCIELPQYISMNIVIGCDHEWWDYDFINFI